VTRDQARAILANIDLIRHFAEGGDIGHRLFNCNGKFVYTSPTEKIVLSNMRPDKLTSYVRVKPKMKWNADLQMYERAQRHWPTKIKEAEIFEEDRIAEERIAT
jgi:hypothetical protein